MSATPINESDTAPFGLWLSRQRKARDLTQQELADRLGCSRWTIQKIEVGSRSPSRQMAELLADYFHVPTAERDAFLRLARGRAGEQAPPRSAIGAIEEPDTEIEHPSNLPVQLTSFVGRDAEVPRVRDLMLMAEVRLLTLTGPPGTGKTRLALQVAAQLLNDFDDGVFFVNLAPINDHRLVIAQIAQTLAVRESQGQSLLESLGTYLKHKHLLLVLDNFEQVVEAAPSVGELLAIAPRLKVLVTSRVPLHIRGEKEYSVPPLHLPDLEHLPPLDRLSRYEAVRLFVDRATDVSVDFELTADNAPAVAQICARLDGLPLAIELAAARIKPLTPQAMLSRLQNRLKLLSSGAKDLQARQQTLRSAIEWSYDLLSGEEKKLFRRLALFQGGGTFEAIEAVCAGGRNRLAGKPAPGAWHLSPLEIDALDGVHSLLDKSMLRPQGGVGGVQRFWMLETIHEYAREKLHESGEAEEMQERHALFFMKLAEEAVPHLMGPKQQEWFDRLDEEHDNMRAALRWASEAHDAYASGPHGGPGGTVEPIEAQEIGLRIAAALGRFWVARGYTREGKAQLERALSLGRASSSDAASATATVTAASGSLSVPAHATIEFRTARARALNWAGVMEHDTERAEALFEQSLALSKELNDRRGIATALEGLGRQARARGDLPAAHALTEQSLQIYQEVGDKQMIAAALFKLAALSYAQGDLPAARALVDQSLALQRELGDKGGIALSLRALGVMYLLEGDSPAARSLFEQSLALQRELGDTLATSWSFYNLASVSYIEGDYPAARSLYEQGLTLQKESGNMVGPAVGLAGLGSVAAMLEEAHRGARLLGAAEALLHALNFVFEADDRIPYERGVAAARARLGEEEFERLRQEGQAMSWEEAIAYALEG